MANQPPSANRATEEATNGMEYLRSFEVRPGVTNRQNWYSTTGRASSIPRKATTLTLMMKGSTTER